MRRSLSVALLAVLFALAGCGSLDPGTSEPPTETDPPTTEAPPATDPPTTEAPPATDPPTTEAPPATEAPTETTVPAEEDGEAGEIPIWVWVLGVVALIGLGALLFRPRPKPVAPAAAPATPTPVAVIDSGAKADAYAEARWLADRLTADLGDFKAQLDSGAIPAPADTDARMQALNAIGERTTAASNALYQAEASATTEAARSAVRASVNAVDGLRSSFDGYVAAAAAGDPGAARGQLDTARQVLSASLESLRVL